MGHSVTVGRARGLRALTCFLIIMIALLVAALPIVSAAEAASIPHVSAQIVLPTVTQRPNTMTTVAIVVDPGAGWHTYWQNPGDSGYPPQIAWRLPPHFSMEPLRHPAPERLVVGGIAMNVHVGTTMLVSKLYVPASARPGEIFRLSGNGSFLVCSSELCVPRIVPLATTVTIGNGASDPVGRATVDRALGNLPVPIALPVPLEVEGRTVRLHLPPGIDNQATHFAAFAVRPEQGVLGRAQVTQNSTDGIDLSIDLGSVRPSTDWDIVLVGHDTKGRKVVSLDLKEQEQKLGVVRGRESPVQPAIPSMWVILAAIGGALLGGLLLNLMPCVFPVLSLKAMALLRSAECQEEARREAAGYLIGSVGVMIALGLTVMSLRAGGESVGWAFQLQNPRIVALLLLLVVAIATNMAGLYELPSLSFAGIERKGFTGGFGAGVLAAFIATPCTGPFMAGALGTALILPTPLATAVFGSLGLGLSLPFLMIALSDRARRALPRPGAWMETLRQLLSLPMFATALGLAWLLGEQAGVPGMTLGLAGSLLLGVGLWLWGIRQRHGRSALPTLAITAGAIGVVLFGGVHSQRVSAHSASAGSFVEYSPARLEAIQRMHRPVLLFATAKWCMTCKLNEATSLKPDRVRATLRNAGALLMEADWTRNDPAVTRLLTANGRAGVPLYIWYPASGAPRILPQILTPDMIMNLVAK